MMLKQIISDDAAEWNIFKLANEKGKFAIQIGPIPDQQQQDAFERGIDNDWWRLVDIGPIEHGPAATMMRIFKLTSEGCTRRNELGSTFY